MAGKTILVLLIMVVNVASIFYVGILTYYAWFERDKLRAHQLWLHRHSQLYQSKLGDVFLKLDEVSYRFGGPVWIIALCVVLTFVIGILAGL